MEQFKLHAPYKPAGDQPKAIDALVNGIGKGFEHQTLLGVTGSGKTFSVANVINQVQKPTLVIAHNKTLAAQLVQEYREFFPENAVQYFVSYYDYYQPEAYVPTSDTYIEKEADINEEIERLRHAATQALLTRPDVIVVASVSCIYGLGSPTEYKKIHLHVSVGSKESRAELIRKLIGLYYERVAGDLTPGTLRALGNRIEVMPANERVIYRVDFSGSTIQKITKIDAITRDVIKQSADVFLFPAKHYVTPEKERERALSDIEDELKEQLAYFSRAGKVLEAERLRRRTRQDIALIREIGYTNGIENYSRHFDRRASGEPPYTLLSYFHENCRLFGGSDEHDFLTVIDESHVTIPQLGGMYAGDRSRKETLIEHGFRLPSAVDNRPLMLHEFEERVEKRLYTSATPGSYEQEHSIPRKRAVVEQIIRPTGLVDPEIEVRPVISGSTHKGQVEDFIDSAVATVEHGGRVLVTTLTKKMAEDLSEFLTERKVKAEYIHSDVKTIDRIGILTDFRRGEFDVLVGVNLLREGLDLPEVELVGILDADKEGFLRSETSLIQTIGRASRNVHGKVILYADEMTGSMERALNETDRRRNIQLAHNKKHGITPKTIKKAIADIRDQLRTEHDKAVDELLAVDKKLFEEDPEKLIRGKKEQMHEAVKVLDFETAAIIRDEIKVLEDSLSKAMGK